LSNIFSGDFIVKVNGLVMSGGARLGVEKSGKIRTQEVMADARITKMDVKFFNLGGVMAGVVQSFLNSGDQRVLLVFEQI
jgi:hypothetical protein